MTSTLSKPLLKVNKPTGPEYVYNDAFTMGLAATDDSDGYVVPRVVPWDDVPSGYGRHQVEYRAIDASGNIGTRRPSTCRRRTRCPGRDPGSARGCEPH